MGRWLAPLAGLAAGLGLAALFGEQLGSILTALLVAAAVVIGVAFLMRTLGGRRRAGPALEGAGAGSIVHEPIRYSGFGHETVAAPPPSQIAHEVAPAEPRATAYAIPAGFDVEGFLRQAKKGFIGLQSANDRGDLEAIRDLTTDDMFAVLRDEVGARGGAVQQVDVVTLDAELLDVRTEGEHYLASVRFSGLMREDAGAAPSRFDEVWHLQKPVAGSAGWLLAGIQQTV
jgi:predicted lipid-binding transport protein (Tim44 family)